MIYNFICNNGLPLCVCESVVSISVHAISLSIQTDLLGIAHDVSTLNIVMYCFLLPSEHNGMWFSKINLGSR